MRARSRPYSRVYWEAPDDPKFVEVWDDNTRLATWLRLLVAADMAWPASASIYQGINRSALKVLCDVGLVDMQAAGRYRIHGLDRERNQRSESARDNANTRWHGSAEGVPSYLSGTAPAMRPQYERNAVGMLAKTRRDETSKDETSNARGINDDGTERARQRQMAYLRGELTAEELEALRLADAVPVTKKGAA